MLFETSLFDKDNFTSHIFINPIDVIKIKRYQDVKKALGKIEQYAQKYYLAGYFSYELGYYFQDSFFKSKRSFLYPLIHLCVFDKAISFNHKTNKSNVRIPNLFTPLDRRVSTNRSESYLTGFIEREENNNFCIDNLRFGFKKPEYINKIMRIKEYIREGQTYQVNFTGKYYFNFSGSAFSFYEDLRNRQSVSYGAFCKFKDEHVISLSPELFFKREGLKIYSKPMKGTIERGKSIAEDKERVVKLKKSIKDLAENLMIVDLVRNDLGRISQVDSVGVAKVFNIEKYNTLFQMTSTVKGILKKDITYPDIFKNIFPGGSVTGAPKIRTMQIIKELENDYRKIYCGALGIIFPRDKAIFNLPIRTISLIKNKGEMGVGAGIVNDSSPGNEFQECLLKAKFLTDRYRTFQLIETFLWRGEYKFFQEHLNRMKGSARYFDFYFHPLKIISCLSNIENRFDRKFSYKIRLLLDKEGDLEIDYSRIAEDKSDKEKYIALSKYRVDPESIFCYHKTTNRDLYDSEYNYYCLKGYCDVIFLNTRNEVTEGAISNIIIEKNKKYYTPPVFSGLLPGIFREYLLKKQNVEEKILFLEDLVKADKIFLCNSVRGLMEVNPVRKVLCKGWGLSNGVNPVSLRSK